MAGITGSERLMVSLFYRNLGLVLILSLAWLAVGLVGRASGGFLLFGGFWVVWFFPVCWRIAASFRAAEENQGQRYTLGQLWRRLTGLTLSVLLSQIALFTLAELIVGGNETAVRALLHSIGIAGSTSLLVPVFFWFRPKDWLLLLFSLLLFSGSCVWWEVARNLWPDELFLAPSIGAVTFALSALLAGPALKRELDRNQSD